MLFAFLALLANVSFLFLNEKFLMKSIAICPGEVSLHQMASQFHLVLFEDGMQEEGVSLL
jgi:hypothetical protein